MIGGEAFLLGQGPIRNAMRLECKDKVANTYSPLHTDHKATTEDIPILPYNTQGLASIVKADFEAVCNF